MWTRDAILEKDNRASKGIKQNWIEQNLLNFLNVMAKSFFLEGRLGNLDFPGASFFPEDFKF